MGGWMEIIVLCLCGLKSLDSICDVLPHERKSEDKVIVECPPELVKLPIAKACIQLAISDVSD